MSLQFLPGDLIQLTKPHHGYKDLTLTARMGTERLSDDTYCLIVAEHSLYAGWWICLTSTRGILYFSKSELFMHLRIASAVSSAGS